MQTQWQVWEAVVWVCFLCRAVGRGGALAWTGMFTVLSLKTKEDEQYWEHLTFINWTFSNETHGFGGGGATSSWRFKTHEGCMWGVSSASGNAAQPEFAFLSLKSPKVFWGLWHSSDFFSGCEQLAKQRRSPSEPLVALDVDWKDDARWASLRYCTKQSHPELQRGEKGGGSDSSFLAKAQSYSRVERKRTERGEWDSNLLPLRSWNEMKRRRWGGVGGGLFKTRPHKGRKTNRTFAKKYEKYHSGLCRRCTETQPLYKCSFGRKTGGSHSDGRRSHTGGHRAFLSFSQGQTEAGVNQSDAQIHCRLI